MDPLGNAAGDLEVVVSRIARLDRYAAGDDSDEALALYDLNAQLGAASGHDFAHLEVGLRDAYDRAITEHLNLPRH